MVLILFLVCWSNNGINYDSSYMRILQKVTKSDLKEFEVPSNVEKILGGSTLESAFYECRNSIQTVTFAEGSNLVKIGEFLFAETSVVRVDMSHCTNVTTLSKCTFYQCLYLETLVLPPNLVTIGIASIVNTRISTLIMPDSVTTIASWDATYGGSMSNNYQLKKIVFGSNPQLQYIGSICFSSSAIEEFEFTPNVTSSTIYGNPFYATSVKKFTVSANHQYLSVDDNGWALLDSKKETIILTVTGINKPFTIPSTIKTINSQAFRSSIFSEIIFENMLHNNIKIKTNAFGNCLFTNISLPEGLTDITESCFAVCQNLTTVIIPSTLQKIEKKAFDRCSKLANIILPEGLTTIGDNAFYTCTSLLNIIIPQKVTDFGSSVFSNCNPGINVIFLDDRFQVVQGMLFDNGDLKEYFGTNTTAELIIPSSCTAIPDNLFESKEIKSISFNESSQCISFGFKSFYECKLTSITLPYSLQSIGSECFQNCPNLLEINFTLTNITVIPTKCFYYCQQLKKVIFENSEITEIQGKAFSQTSSLEFFDLENSIVEKIGENAFENSALNSINFPITLNETSPYFFYRSELRKISFRIESYSIKDLPSYGFAECMSLEIIELCDSITVIKDYCFQSCINLRNITLGKGITEIKMHAFENCVLFSKLIIPEESELKTIEEFAFQGCTSFDKIDVKATDRFSFEDRLLMNANQTDIIYYLSNSKEKTILLPSSIVKIADYAFQHANYLNEVLIPSGSLNEIGYRSFYGCSQLRRIIIPKSVTRIQEEAFEGCNMLQCGCVIIHEDVINITLNLNLTKIGINNELVNGYCSSINCPISFNEISCKYSQTNLYSLKILSLIFIGTQHK